MSENNTSSNIIQVTAAARQELQKVMAAREEQAPYLRLGLAATGCSGYQFMLTFEDTKTGTDVQQDFDGLAIVIAQKEIDQVNGVVIDFEQSGDRGNFIIDNPNRKQSCDCGGSCCC